MASQSPAADPSAAAKRADARPYLEGWAALSRLMNRGVSWSGRERNCVYMNLAGGRFVDASFASGLDFADDGRAVAVADWDADGDLDLWLKNRTGPQLRFMRNDQPKGGHWLEIRLVGTTCNRDAVGASVELRVAGRTLRRTVVAGDGYLSQSSRWLHFGLGEDSGVDDVTVRWPGGGSQRIEELVVDQRFEIRQGDATVRRVPRPPAPAWNEAPASDAIEGPTRVLLRTPLPLPPSLSTPGGSTRPAGRATLINLWAHWCAPCIEELGAFADRHADIRDGGLDVVAWSVDSEEDAPLAAALFDERIAVRMPESPFARGRVDGDLAQTVDAVLTHVLLRHDELSLPTSLLVDPRGRLQMVYLGAVTPEQLLADARKFALGSVKGAFRSVYPGRWYARMPRDLEALAAELERRGRLDDAAFYRRTARQLPRSAP